MIAKKIGRKELEESEIGFPYSVIVIKGVIFKLIESNVKKIICLESKVFGLQKDLSKIVS